MIHKIRSSRPLLRGLSVVGVAAGVMLAASAASAGECPADKVGVEVTKPGAMKPKDVADKLLAKIDLSKEKLNLSGRSFRIRKLVVQPGGIVPWHSHADRPALIYIVSGSITEYASNCAVPIEHKTGEVSVEQNGLAHWWKNNGKTPAVLISSDIFHEKEDPQVM